MGSSVLASSRMQAHALNFTCVRACPAPCVSMLSEIEMSLGWVECVGIADRSAYDLTCHSKATGVALTAQRDLPVRRARGSVGGAIRLDLASKYAC
eukprot:2310089-Pleurochrysis_carterae.AAC.1